MSAKTSAAWPLLCAAVAVLVHVRALDNGFALDDVRLVENNPAITSLARIPRIFAEPYYVVEGEHYGAHRPVTIASFAIDRSVFGPRPRGFHLVNVVLHASVTALAWFALRGVATYYGTAFLGAMLFAVLPIHTEAVANIAGRAELLAALFVLLGWLAHRRAGTEGTEGARWPLFAALAYLAALLSKESAILAPVLYFAADALEKRGTTRSRWRLAGGYAMALIAMAALRLAALGSHQGAESAMALDNPAAAAGFWPRIFTALWVQLQYALIGVAPVRLVSDYSFDAIPVARSLADWRVWGGLAFVVGLFVALLWGWKRSRPAAVAVLLWLLFFLPSANLLFGTGTIMGERLAYLPSLGLCLALAHICAAVAGRPGTALAVRAHGIGTVAVSAIVVLGFAAQSNARVSDWKDNLTLATTDVATMPRSAKLQAGAGIFLADAGRNSEAEDHLRRAVEIYPDYAQMHYNLAVLLARRGARDEAIEHLRRAIDLAPDNPLPRALLDRLGSGPRNGHN